MMNDKTCFTCKHKRFMGSDYLYPFKCCLNKAVSYRTEEAMIRANCNLFCAKHEPLIDKSARGNFEKAIRIGVQHDKP